MALSTPCPRKKKDAKTKSAINKFGKLSFKHAFKSVSCPSCGIRIVFKALNDHMRAMHNINPQLKCIYCNGKFVWQRGEAQSNHGVMEHRFQCLTAYIESSEEDDTVLPTIEDGKPPCACVAYLKTANERPDMQGRVRLSTVGSSFYKPFGNQQMFRKRDGSRHVVFTESSGLGLFAHNVFRYFLSGKYKFFHIMVRAVLWDQFDAAYRGGDLLSPAVLHVLPYGCLCDKSHKFPKKDPLKGHHRHLLIMMDARQEKQFAKEWKALTLPGKTGRNKLRICIKDAKHLMNVVWYVSNPSASCAGPNEKGSHYWIERKLYPHAKIAMAALWKEGHQTLLTEMLLNRAPDRFHEHIRDGKRVQLKYVKLKESNCPIPFADGYVLVDDTGRKDRPTVYMHGTRMQLEFRLDPPSVMEKGWFEFQKSCKNVMWNAVLEEDYMLEHHQVRAHCCARRLEIRLKEEFEAKLAKVQFVLKVKKLKVERLLAQVSRAKMNELEHASDKLRLEEENKQLQSEIQKLRERLSL